MDVNKQASESMAGTNRSAADHLVTSFIEITSANADEALFFLESHNFDLDAAVSTFYESSAPSDAADAPAAAPSPAEMSPSPSPSRSRSPSPASRSQYNLRSSRRDQPGSGTGSGSGPAAAAGRRLGGIRTFSDLNRTAAEGSDTDDQPPEYYTGGEKSGMLVQDPRGRGNDVDSIFDQARQFGVDPADAFPSSSSSRSFTGRGRLLSGETVSAPPQVQPPESVTHIITFWQNGFTVDDGPLRRIDDPANTTFLESIRKSECPRELEPADRRTTVRVSLARKDQNYQEQEKQRKPFQGSGRTLGSSTNSNPAPSPSLAPASLSNAPAPSVGLVVDPNLPTTSIQLRLADGTRMVSRFNLHHTVREIRGFIDASRPSGRASSYSLQTMGFPPKQLTDLDQTIEQAGLANSVIIQRL